MFIPVGWNPNENLAALVKPMTKMLLPLLIAYTGGQLVTRRQYGRLSISDRTNKVLQRRTGAFLH
jgi:mannitol-specific phosphotransferase system IIBC component